MDHIEERKVEVPAAELGNIHQPNPKGHPILNDNHKRIVRWLNMLPIKKELVFCPELLQTHTLFINILIGKEDFQTKGVPALRHLVDSIIM